MPLIFRKILICGPIALWILPIQGVAATKSPILCTKILENMTHKSDPIETELARNNVLSVTPLISAMAESPLRMELEGGITAVFKPFAGRGDREKRIKGEITAYHLDRLLQLGVVPVTVDREINGVRGIVQLFVPNAVTADSVKLKEGEKPTPCVQIQLLDILLGNPDRNAGNWMISPDGREVAIDNELSFSPHYRLEVYGPRDLESLALSPDLVHRISLIPEAWLREELKGVDFDSSVFKGFEQRRKLLLQAFPQTCQQNN